MWTPRLRCTPEHSMQMRMPKLITAHFGCAAPQSAHLALLLIVAGAEVTLIVRDESGALRRLVALETGTDGTVTCWAPGRAPRLSPAWIEFEAVTLSEVG